MIISLSCVKMASLKQEPVTEEQWAQFIKNMESQTGTYLSDCQNTAFDQEKLSVYNTDNQSFGPTTGQAADNMKSEPIDSTVDWTFTNPTDQFEIPADNVPNSNFDPRELQSRLGMIQALYGHRTSFRVQLFTLSQGGREFKV